MTLAQMNLEIIVQHQLAKRAERMREEHAVAEYLAKIHGRPFARFGDALDVIPAYTIH